MKRPQYSFWNPLTNAGIGIQLLPVNRLPSSIVRPNGKRLSCSDEDKDTLKHQRDGHARVGNGKISHPGKTLNHKQTKLSQLQCSDWARTSRNTDLATLGKIGGALRHVESSNGDWLPIAKIVQAFG